VSEATTHEEIGDEDLDNDDDQEEEGDGRIIIG